jgi:hypothetical protein
MPNKELERRGAILSPVELPDEEVSPGDDGECVPGRIRGSQLLEEVLPTYRAECPHFGWGRLRETPPLLIRKCGDCGAYLTRVAVEEDRQCWRDQQQRPQYIPNEKRAVFWHVLNLAAFRDLTRTVDGPALERMKRMHYVPVNYPVTPPEPKPTRKKKPKSWEIGAPPSLASILRSRLRVFHSVIFQTFQFTRRVLHTERLVLIQTKCVRCGFTTIGVKERIERIEKEHPRECKGSAGLTPRGTANPAA